MKNITLIAVTAAIAGGITWLFTTEKGKNARQIIADKSCQLFDAAKNAFAKDAETNQGHPGTATV